MLYITLCRQCIKAQNFSTLVKDNLYKYLWEQKQAFHFLSRAYSGYVQLFELFISLLKYLRCFTAVYSPLFVYISSVKPSTVPYHVSLHVNLYTNFLVAFYEASRNHLFPFFDACLPSLVAVLFYCHICISNLCNTKWNTLLSAPWINGAYISIWCIQCKPCFIRYCL